jgi:hypothetical protein
MPEPPRRRLVSRSTGHNARTSRRSDRSCRLRCAGCLDAEYLTATGNGIRTIVSNTNTSKDSEEGLGYGASLLTFATQLANSASIPNVLSLSIGSLSFASCDKMCKMIEDKYSYDKCWAFLTTTQRQVWDRSASAVCRPCPFARDRLAPRAARRIAQKSVCMF